MAIFYRVSCSINNMLFVLDETVSALTCDNESILGIGEKEQHKKQDRPA